MQKRTSSGSNGVQQPNADLVGHNEQGRAVSPLRIRLLSPTATVPARAEPGSVGYDLSLDIGGSGSVVLLPGQRRVASTGIAAAIPSGCYGRVAPRSGLAAKLGIDVLAGVIDPSYRGEILVCLLNTGDDPVPLQHGARIAQLILERCETPEVEIVEALDATSRGAGGFGSSG